MVSIQYLYWNTFLRCIVSKFIPRNLVLRRHYCDLSKNTWRNFMEVKERRTCISCLQSAPSNTEDIDRLMRSSLQPIINPARRQSADSTGLLIASQDTVVMYLQVLLSRDGIYFYLETGFFIIPGTLEWFLLSQWIYSTTAKDIMSPVSCDEEEIMTDVK